MHGKKGVILFNSYQVVQGTKLFQSLDKPDVMYAMAEWKTKPARDVAMNALVLRTDAHTVLHAREELMLSYETIISAYLIIVSDPS